MPLDRLLTAGQTGVALRSLFGSGTPVLSGSLLVRLARAVLDELGSPDTKAGPNLHRELEQLFEQIDRATEIPRSEVAALEWQFLPILIHTRRKPRVLHQTLASDPALFAQIIRLNYRRRDGAADPEQEALAPDKRKSLANLAGQLLSSWKSPLPGDGPTGLDEGTLSIWVAEARRLCAEADRAEIGDQKIGELLARGPVDSTDGAWPHRAVRQALASVRSEDLDTGFRIGVSNGRGVTSRGLHDGGAQERAEADRYKAWAKAIRHSHRTRPAYSSASPTTIGRRPSTMTTMPKGTTFSSRSRKDHDFSRLHGSRLRSHRSDAR